MKGKDLLSIADLTSKEIWQLITSATKIKQDYRRPFLLGKSLALIFEKPSLRTKVSFDLAMRELGGHAIYLSQSEVGLGKREPISDVAQVLSRYVDCIVVRTFSHQDAEELARYATIPVINGLTDEEHPCQALSDLLTIYEKKGKLKGLTLAFIGDANNVANSLILAASLVGMNFRIASPNGYQVKERVLSLARRFGSVSGATILLTEEPATAAEGADVVYTDVWTSMGQEAEAEHRRKVFARYQVDEALLAKAHEDAIFMHPLPAHHGEEIAKGLLDSPHSVVFDQAENRLHLQKALLLSVIAGIS